MIEKIHQKVKCEGVTVLNLHKEFPNKYELVCLTCRQGDICSPYRFKTVSRGASGDNGKRCATRYRFKNGIV